MLIIQSKITRYTKKQEKNGDNVISRQDVKITITNMFTI